MNDWDLYLVTEEELSAGRSTVEVVKEALAGGVDVIQLREKNKNTRHRYKLGKKLKELTDQEDVDLIVNDDLDLVMALEADGVHLGDDDLPVEVARNLLGPEKIIGLSTSNLAEAEAAKKSGADYIGFGAVYKTTSKDVSERRQAVGLEKLKQVSGEVEIPITAIGGLDQTNLAEVIQAGADSAAVISALTQAEDISKQASRLKEIVRRNKNG